MKDATPLGRDVSNSTPASQVSQSVSFHLCRRWSNCENYIDNLSKYINQFPRLPPSIRHFKRLSATSHMITRTHPIISATTRFLVLHATRFFTTEVNHDLDNLFSLRVNTVLFSCLIISYATAGSNVPGPFLLFGRQTRFYAKVHFHFENTLMPSWISGDLAGLSRGPPRSVHLFEKRFIETLSCTAIKMNRRSVLLEIVCSRYPTGVLYKLILKKI